MKKEEVDLPMAAILRQSLKTIEHYKHEQPHYGELLDILEEVLILREKHRRSTGVSLITLDERIAGEKMSGGFPLVDFAEGELDLEAPEAYFRDLLEIGKKKSPEESARILEELASGALSYEALVRNSFTESLEELPEEGEDAGEEERAAEGEDEVFDLLTLFVEESLRPSLEKIAEWYAPLLKKKGWNEGFCPICGREPKLAEIRSDEGTRFLFCNQCGYEWSYLRLKCPFCGNDDQDTLAYFSVEGEEQYRVDVCNNCNRYIKTVDFRKMNRPACLDVEDLATIHLDILANEEGYE
jgi:FdhE protein